MTVEQFKQLLESYGLKPDVNTQAVYGKYKAGVRIWFNIDPEFNQSKFYEYQVFPEDYLEY